MFVESNESGLNALHCLLSSGFWLYLVTDRRQMGRGNTIVILFSVANSTGKLPKNRCINYFLSPMGTQEKGRIKARETKIFLSRFLELRQWPMLPLFIHSIWKHALLSGPFSSVNPS